MQYLFLKIQYFRLFMLFAGLFILVGLLLFFHSRGLLYYDEGYILNSALKVVHGEIPYRDFDVIYTPLSFLITASFLKTFGESVFSGRLAALAISLASLFALHRLLLLITKNKILIFISLLFFILWGPAHVNFSWPTMFALCFYLYATLFYTLGAMRKREEYFLFAGISTALTFFSKQNFGTGLILVSIILFYFQNRGQRLLSLKKYLLGLLSFSFLAALLLLLTSSFIPFIQNTYYYTFQKIIIGHINDTPFLYAGSWLSRVLKLLFYTLPIWFVFAAITSSWKNKRLVIISLFVITFYIFGIRPTTDYDHFVTLLALSILSLVIIIVNVKGFLLKLLWWSSLIGLVFVGFYTAYFGGYYKWETPLVYDNMLAVNPRLKIYTTSYVSALSNQLISYIDSRTKPNDYIFVNFYAPLIYFLSNRQNATHYDFSTNAAMTKMQQESIIDNLQEKSVQLVIMAQSGENENSSVGKYILQQYKKDVQIGTWYLYIRKEKKK